MSCPKSQGRQPTTGSCLNPGLPGEPPLTSSPPSQMVLTPISPPPRRRPNPPSLSQTVREEDHKEPALTSLMPQLLCRGPWDPVLTAMGNSQVHEAATDGGHAHLQKDFGFADLPVIMGAQHGLSHTLACPPKVVLGVHKGMRSPPLRKPPESPSQGQGAGLWLQLCP